MVKQTQLNKMPIISKEDLENRKDSIRNYFVYIGENTPVDMIEIHVGLLSNNHYETIKQLAKAPVFKVLEDNRKMK